MLVVCERWVEDGDRLLHIDPSSSDHSSTSFLSWPGLLNRESLMVQSRWLSLRHLVPNCLQLARSAPGTWLDNYLTTTCFRCSSTYLHRCISWLTTRSRVNMLHDVSVGTVHTIIREELKMRKICAKFVPRVLREDQKDRRCSDPEILDALVTWDKSWIYCYDSETKR